MLVGNGKNTGRDVRGSRGTWVQGATGGCTRGTRATGRGRGRDPPMLLTPIPRSKHLISHHRRPTRSVVLVPWPRPGAIAPPSVCTSHLGAHRRPSAHPQAAIPNAWDVWDGSWEDGSPSTPPAREGLGRTHWGRTTTLPERKALE